MVVELVRLLLLVCREPVTLLWQYGRQMSGEQGVCERLLRAEGVS